MSQRPNEDDTVPTDKKPARALAPITAADLAERIRALVADGPEMRRIVASNPSLQDYADYLKSPLWKRIKKRVMTRDDTTCQSCDGQASVVHHRSYAPAVMEGKDDSMLTAVCNGCHERIHFTDEGEKRSTDESDAVFVAGQRHPIIPLVGKINLRKPTIKYPGMTDRVTSLQIEMFEVAFYAAWREQIAARKVVKQSASMRKAQRGL